MKEIKISPKFKTQTTNAVLSIILFVLTYLFILALAVGLTVLSVYGGIMLIVTFPKFITFAIGIGLASLGFFILFFLLKFMFKSHKVDRSHLTEIKQLDEPKLFKMIDDIVKEVGTTFPKKVYLSPDVNAAVFYDSSFWSMFFPIKKNLLIGLGDCVKTNKFFLIKKCSKTPSVLIFFVSLQSDNQVYGLYKRTKSRPTNDAN